MDKDKNELDQLHQFAADLLSKVSKYEITPECAIEKWPRNSNDQLIEAGLHALIHFRDDSDIRGKDQKYKLWQESQLNELANALQSGELAFETSEWIKPRFL